MFILDDDNVAPFAPVPDNLILRQPNSCVVCLSEPSTHACAPCGHRCICETCSTSPLNRCPLCQGEIILIMSIFN